MEAYWIPGVNNLGTHKRWAFAEFTENIARRMDELGITRSELARRLDTSPAYVTKILRGNANFNLKSMARISLLLESALTTHLQPEDAHSRLRDHGTCKAAAYSRTPKTPIPASSHSR